MRRLHVWSDERALGHLNCTPGHPESPERWRVIRSMLEAQDWPVEWRCPDPADAQAVERVHAPGYVAALRRHLPEKGCVMLDGDTGLSPGSLEAALSGAGGVVEAVEAALSGVVARGFCLHRPPGHHAEPDRPMGFCLINHVAVGAAHALALGVSRLAVVDFDVHHGNGTERMLAGVSGVRFYSSFQHPFFPDSGWPPLAGNCVSLPLRAGTDGAAFRQAWAPAFAALADWSPELVLVSAGFDAHVDDPLGGLSLTAADFAWLGAQLSKLGDAPVISVLEGGYELSALSESVRAYLAAQL